MIGCYTDRLKWIEWLFYMLSIICNSCYNIFMIKVLN